MQVNHTVMWLGVALLLLAASAHGQASLPDVNTLTQTTLGESPRLSWLPLAS